MTVLAPSRPVVLALALTDLEPHPKNRKRFDPVRLEELAQGLLERGQLTPALVRPQGDGYQILAGERRWRAAKAAGLATLDCVVRELDDQAALEIVVIENNQREDVHPLEEAELFKALLAFTGNDVAAIARKLHRSVAYVYDRLKLLQLVPAARTLFLEGTIQIGHAILLARLTKADQKRCLEDRGGLLEREQTLFDPEEPREQEPPQKACSVRELQAWIDKHVRFDPASADLPQLFPETAAALRDAGERQLTVVEITHEHYVQPEAREGDRIIGPRSWKRADGTRGSKPCDHQVLGTIVAGPGRGKAFLVCIAKQQCPVHWAQEKKEAARRARERQRTGAAPARGGESKPAKLTPAEKRARVEGQRNAALHRRFEQAQDGGALLAAVAKGMTTAKFGAKTPAFEQLLDNANEWERNAKLEALVPRGQGADQLLRHAAWVAFLGRWAEDGQDLAGADRLLAPLGLTLTALLDAVAPVTLDEATAFCETCGCTQNNACPGGCGWDPASWAKGKAVCTQCTSAKPAKKLAGDVRRARKTKKGAAR